MKYEARKMTLIIFLETSNIEWGQIDPKGNRRVKRSVFAFPNAIVPNTLQDTQRPRL